MNTLFGDVYQHSNGVNSLSDDIELRWNGEHLVRRC